jgi:hypothetical protein
MNKVTKHLAAFGLTMAMFLPVAALAVASPVGVAPGEPVQLAQSNKDLTDITKNLGTVGTETGLGTQSLPVIVGGIINAALGIIGIVMVVIIIFAGYKWMMAQGNSQQVDEAKKMITNAVIGLIILMASYAIATFVINAIIKGTTGTAPTST